MSDSVIDDVLGGIAMEPVKEPAKRSMTNVPTVEKQEMLHAYVEQDMTLRTLTDLHQVNLYSLARFARNHGWQQKKIDFQKKERESSGKKLSGMSELGLGIAKDAKAEEQAFKDDPVKAAQERNAKMSRMMDRVIDQLSLALGVTDKDYTLYEKNPSDMTAKIKELVTDKDANSNYIRLFDKLKDAMVMQRLINGQSTSAANREDPADQEDDTQAVLIRMAQIDGLDETDDNDTPDKDLDMLL